MWQISRGQDTSFEADQALVSVYGWGQTREDCIFVCWINILAPSDNTYGDGSHRRHA